MLMGLTGRLPRTANACISPRGKVRIAMKKWKQAAALLLAVVMLFTLASCGGSKEQKNKTITIAVPFVYDSLDTHKDFQGWYTSIYGVTESLFKMDDAGKAVPCLAKSAKQDGKTWTIKLNRKARFSNGDPVTSSMVARNLQRAGKVNNRYKSFNTYKYDTSKKHVLTITTPSPVPTLKNTLSSPCLGILDLDGSKDLDTSIIGTGPFTVLQFTPHGNVSVVRNEHYWNGKVYLSAANFYYAKQDAPKLLGMRLGNLDAVTNVTSDALTSYRQDPHNYNIVSVPGSRLLYFYLNHKTLDANLRKAINGYLSKSYVEKFLHGAITRTTGPFKDDLPYGKAKAPAKLNADQCKGLIQKSGYTLNSDGIFEKDGTPLKIRISTYGSYSLDALAKLMQKQLKRIGIDSTITVAESPDADYMKTGDFDVAFYSLIPDKENDPYDFLEKTMGKDGSRNPCSYGNKKTESLLNELKNTEGAAKRAKLANQLVQMAVDSGDFGYIGLVNKITVLRKGVSGISETSPYDFYCLTKDSTVK